MSKYLEDVQGKIVSNPINETNTKYPYINPVDGVRHGDEYPIDSQYMYNHNEPVSDIDTAYYADYRNKVEELRKRTESTYEALESCLVPVEIPGMSFQPYEFLSTETDDGEVIEEKVKSFTYFFQDHLSPIGVDSKEFVFRTNKVKFIDDRHRRLIYDRTIHIMSTKEDEDNKVTFKEVLLRTFFEYYNGQYYSRVRDLKTSTTLSYDTIATNIWKLIEANKEKYRMTDADGIERDLASAKDFENYIMKSGQDIDTTIPSTLYNLYNIGWTNAAMVFLNGLAIRWTKIILSVDNIDTFIIISNLSESVSELINDDEEIFLDYVHIPFKVAYLIGNADNNFPEYLKYFSDNKLTKDVIFVINKNDGTIEHKSLFNEYNHEANYYEHDRIICLDPNIKYAEFALEDKKLDDRGNNITTESVGINYTKSFKEFCGNDYRCKLKQFNFLGFEVDRYENSKTSGTFKNDDFTITWHPFNIMDIRFKRLYNRKRVFKVFYNTKVLYDQDNVLRIKNHVKLADEYEQYRKDVTANIETYINEIYILAKKDIGTYVATNGIMYDYKFHYVTPYECFLLYNAINTVMTSTYTSFDDFKNIDVGGIKNDSSSFKSVINPKLVANESGNCVWRIPVGDKQVPVVKITELGTGDDVLANINYSNPDEIVITMNRNAINIPENTYKATLYYADAIYGNNKLPSSDGKCCWTIPVRDVDAANSTVTVVYETETKQIVLPDIRTEDNKIIITINSTEDIPKDKYMAVIHASSADSNSHLNYLNGGFIAVPKDEESIFAEKIKESDIFNNKVLNDSIRQYFSNIISNVPSATIPDILVPIDNETRDDEKLDSNAFYMYEGDSRGKIIPYTPIMNEFGLVQEYDDLQYDVLKLRFELCYLNNMEEGATPVDEFIYYFDKEEEQSESNEYPVVSETNIESRKAALTLDILADNIFKTDPHLVLDSIKKLNWSADYIIHEKQEKNREECITTWEEPNPNSISEYNYKLDPRFYYNYGYYDENGVPHKVVSEWGLRRNLPEMFIYKLDQENYTLDSMHLLDEVFDFTYSFDKTYEENLKHGLKYIVGYDADKLEQSIKRSIVSLTKTGKELKTQMTGTQYEKTCTLDGYKLITFIKNKNQKIVFDNIQFIVTLRDLGDSVTPYSVEFINESGIKRNLDYYTVNMKHKSQEYYTIMKTSSSFVDIDKNFSQSFTSVKYNRKTELLEYYNNDELVITLQVDKVIDLCRVVMSRWNISNQDNYVMIFKNRELYSKYHTIEYTDISFSFELEDSALKDDDKFEFVFFLNANNTIMKKICETDEDLQVKIPNAYYSNESTNSIRVDMNGNRMDKGLYDTITETVTLNKAIPCNTSVIDAENVQLLVNVMPNDTGDTWNVSSTENTTYELSYTMKSYKATTSDYNSTVTSADYNSTKRFVHTLTDDNKLNGLHRVTKQGGGEYFLEFDGKVPETTGTTIVINPSEESGGTSGSSGITGIGYMAFATQNVNFITYSGTSDEWKAISKTLPWIRDATNLNNNNGGVNCLEDETKVIVPKEETYNGRSGG